MVILTDPSKRLVIPVYFSNSKIKIVSGVRSLFDFILSKKSYRNKFLAHHIKNLIYLLKINHHKHNYQLNYLLNKNDIKNFIKLKKPWFFLNVESHYNHNNWNIDYYKKILLHSIEDLYNKNSIEICMYKYFGKDIKIIDKLNVSGYLATEGYLYSV